MIKKQIAQYTGMSKDLSRNKQSDKYFDAKNIRILATDQKSSFAVTNEVGNELIFSIPIPVFDNVNTQISYQVGDEIKNLSYTASGSSFPRCELESEYMTDAVTVRVSGVQKIIGTKELRDSAIIVTTDNSGFDCIWELKNLNKTDFDLDLLYMGDLGLSTSALVQILYNYENSVIQKIYLVDGVHQLRYFNIRQSVENGDSINLIDVSSQSVDTVSTFTLSQPDIIGTVNGGSHTSGMIQYAYSLYILNGAQTTVSPLSELIPIDKGDGIGGGEINEVLGKSVLLNINNIDSKFTNVIVYSIKYTSYNEVPEITVVADKEIDNFNLLSITDDGTSQLSISLEKFVFLGSSPIVPKHIVSKDNRLFPINITEQLFDIDLDFRAYSFDASPVPSSRVIDTAFLNEDSEVDGQFTTINPSTFNLRDTHDAINADYNEYKYQSDGVTLGASGKYVEVELVQSNLTDEQAGELQFLKDREIYRIGIKFYNQRGQTSDPKWIMDLQAPEGNLEGNYNQLRVTLTSEFNTWLQDGSNFNSKDDIPVGYKILRADRTLTDQTIFAQGLINPMIANHPSSNKARSKAECKERVNGNGTTIMPSVIRKFVDLSPFNRCVDYFPLEFEAGSSESTAYTNSNYRGNRKTEGFKSPGSSSNSRAQNFQQNRLMQFFSPEVLFRTSQIDASYSLKIVGLSKEDYVANWATESSPLDFTSNEETKFINGINSDTPGVNDDDVIEGSASSLMDKGFFGPTNNATQRRAIMQMYRSFQGEFKKSLREDTFGVYGSPEITDRGANFKKYNGDDSFKYGNNLKTMLIDRFNTGFEDADVSIKGCNTIGARCITFAEGNDESNFPVESRRSIEQIRNDSSIQDDEKDGVLIAEFVKEDYIKYTGNIYGGMSNESKSVSTYIEIGEFTDINQNTVFIESPGDTFVDTFTFSKMAKDDVDIASNAYNIVQEIVSVKVETTVDLKNRNDLSLDEWDGSWIPKMDEYEKYNTVYSQQPSLIKSVGTGNKIKKIKSFDGRIMASKSKIPGEFIDSWTDFLENETMDLDGKYGPVNAVVNLKDEIFCLQDTGVAMIAINPRVQVQSLDGIGLELGTGGILNDYKYISTTVGCLNKWGVIGSENAFYFVDAINRGIMSFSGQLIRLSDINGFHHELLNRMNYDELTLDNPVLGNGISVGYNPVNADVYFSFHQSKDNFTIAFNEKIGQFVSYYDYVPSWYINKGSVLISSNPSHNEIWEHFKGTPNYFYGQHFKSSLTLHLAPGGGEIILNNASYKMELTDENEQEVLNKGLTSVRVYNDYQDSGDVELIMRKNVFKKFRNWKINFPRQKGTRERVRSAWGFAEFSFENEDGNKLILHDISLFFTQY